MIGARQRLRNFNTPAKRACRVAVALVAMAALALSGCGRPDDGKVHLQLSTWGSAEELADLKTLLTAYEAEHPGVKVELLHIPENYYQKLHILVAGGMTPDVMFTNSISFPVYASQGIFLDLEPYLAEDGGLSREDFYAPALKALSWREESGEAMLGALPRDVSNLVMFYNRDRFRKAGLGDPRPGWTWEDFLAAAQKLTVDADRDGSPEVFGVSFDVKPPLFWLPYVWSAGGQLFSEDMKRVALDSPEAMRGLQFYTDLRNRYHVAPRLEESGGQKMTELFLQERVAMMVNGRWSVPALRRQAGFDWDVAPLPVGPSGQSRVGIDASGYAVAADSAHPRESYELAAFLVSRPAIEKVTESGLIVPARPDVAASERFLAPDQQPRASRTFLDVIPHGVPTRTPPRWNEFSEALILTLQPVFEGRKPLPEALQKAKPELEALLQTGGG